MTRHDDSAAEQCGHSSDPGDVRVPLAALEQAAETNRLGLIRVDVATRRIFFANAWFCDMVGYSWHELVEPSITTKSLIHPEYYEHCAKAVRRLTHDEAESCTFDSRCVRKDGTAVPVRLTMAKLERSPDDGRALSICVIASPVIPQHAKSQVETHGVSFWYFDFLSRTGNCSASFLKLLDLPADAPVPNFRACLAQVHPEDQMRVLSDMQRIKKGIFSSSEFRFYRASGELRWVNQAIKPVIDSIGEVVGVVGACLDITDAKCLVQHSPFALTVRAVKHYVDQHWDEPLSIARLSEMAGVNTRTLFKHFKLACAYTPQEYIKRVRLNHARALLLMADKSTTVLGTALKCCFQNQGHFARDYRLAFGERPSETLERARRGDAP